MILAGPRVCRIGGTILALRRGARKPGWHPCYRHPAGPVHPAIPWTASFEQILVFSGATGSTPHGLRLITSLETAARTPFRWPLPPHAADFPQYHWLDLTYVVIQRPVEALISAAIILTGGVFYLAVKPTTESHS